MAEEFPPATARAAGHPRARLRVVAPEACIEASSCIYFVQGIDPRSRGPQLCRTSGGARTIFPRFGPRHLGCGAFFRSCGLMHDLLIALVYVGMVFVPAVVASFTQAKIEEES